MAPDTAARATSPLQPENPAYLAGRARSATLIAAAGLGTFFALVAVTRNTFLALYATRYGYRLRNLARHLQAKVAERTAELSAVNAELAAKARALEEKQDELKSFVYTVTHDLKSPLSAILLIADLLLQREGAGLAAEGREDLERIVRLAGGTEDMIRDLLELFRIPSQPEAPAWVELGGLVERGLETLHPQLAAEGVRVAVGPLPRVWGQAGKLGHVGGNMLRVAVNDVRASP